MIYVLILGKYPFQGNTPSEIKKAIEMLVNTDNLFFSQKFTQISEAGQDLIMSLLQTSPSRRLSAQ